MRSWDHRTRGQDGDWRFSPHAYAHEATRPSARQRAAAAIAGVACALVLYAWAVPPVKNLQTGSAAGHVTLTRVVPDALRALTGLAASAQAASAQRASTVPGAGIRN